MKSQAAAFLLLAAPLAAQQFNEIEPNDVPAQAQDIALGTQVNCFLDPSGRDWFKFTTTGGHHVIATAGCNTTITDIRCTMFDVAGTTPLAYVDNGPSSLPGFAINLAAGTYLLRVDATGVNCPVPPTLTGCYSIDVSLPMAKPYTGAESEPNDTIATANPVGDGAKLLASLAPPVTAVLSGAAASLTSVGSFTTSATASTNNTLERTGLVNGAFNGVGYSVRINSGPLAGQIRYINSNTTNIITVSVPFSGPVAVGTSFDVFDGASVFATGTLAAGTTTSLTPTTPPPSAGYYIAATFAVRMTSGPNAGLSRTISSNTDTQIVTAAWPVANAAGNTFQIVAGNTRSAFRSTSVLAAGQFDDAAHWVRFTTGANAGQSRNILRNGGSTLVLVNAFDAAIDPGDAYEIDRYDCDTYRIDVTAPKAAVAFSILEGDAPWVSGYSYAVVDGAGMRVASRFLGQNLADSSESRSRTANLRVWPAGTYYVRVFQRRMPYPVTACSAPKVAYGFYRFEVRVKGMNVGGTVAETEAIGTQSNNTVATAQAIVPGQRGTGNVTASAGVDPTDLWGPFSIASQSIITFQVTAGATGAPMTDATLNLRQLIDPATGALGGFSSSVSGNILEVSAFNPRAEWAFNEPGTVYYVEVASAGTAAGMFGDYELEISLPDSLSYTRGGYFDVASNVTGCGTPGVPTIDRVLAGVSNGEAPIVGQTFVQRVTNLNGFGNLGLLLVGLSGALGPSGAAAGTPQSIYNPQPLDLTFFGAPGCVLDVNPLDIQVLVGDPTGAVVHVLPIPGNLALSGFSLFFQPCKWDLVTPVNGLGIQPGNWSRIRVGTSHDVP